MTDDPELLRRYAEEGSQDAFAELVKRHIDFVYAAALRRSRNAQRAEDITQIAFTALARQSKALHHRTELVGWLYTTVRFAAAKTIRTEVRRQRREQEARLMEEVISDPGRQPDWTQLYPMLDEALADLPSADRNAVLLRFFKNNTFAEIGTALQMPEDTARKRVSRAVHRLQASFSQRGLASTTAALAEIMAAQSGSAAPAGLATSVTGAAIAAGTAPALVAFAVASSAKIAIGLAVVAAAISLAVVAHRIRPAVAAPLAKPASIVSLASPPNADTIASDLDRALAYDEGGKTARDPKQAARWYRRAADKGSGSAELQLGIFAETGDGLPQDYKVARTHYARALTLGVPAAGLRLGIMNLEGWGAEKDLPAAVALITQAADAGDIPSQKVLAGMYFAGVDVKADLHQALAWEERAAKDDDPEAESVIGGTVSHLYKENSQLAREWYQLSAEQDYANGMIGMASTFLRPGASEEQADLGRKWLELAAKDGNGPAAAALASLYLLHPAYASRPDSPAKARKFLEQAEQSGDSIAGEVLQLASSGQTLVDALKYVATVPMEQRYVRRFAPQRLQDSQNASGTYPPAVLKMVTPVYPMVFQLTRKEADVLVDFVVDTTGRVRRVTAIKSPHPEFSRSAVLAVQSWLFVPARKNGHLVNTHMRLPVSFRLYSLHDYIHHGPPPPTAAPAE